MRRGKLGAKNHNLQGKGMGKIKQKVGGKWEFSYQKCNWEWQKLKPEYHKIMKMCGIWGGNGK